MLKIRLAVVVLGVLFPSAALAQPAPTAGLAGIWEGPIGGQPARLCFTTREWGTFGAFYYPQDLHLTALQAEDGAPGTYAEGVGDPGAARWRNLQVVGGVLTARRTTDGRTVAVRFRRVAGGDGEQGACASMDFQRPRLVGIRTNSTRATVDGTAYTKLTLDTQTRFQVTVETFALDGDSAAVRRINNALGEELAGTPPRWFGCITNTLEQSGLEGEQSLKLEPAMISRRWLSVSSQGDWSCGGAHPSEDSSYRLFDLTTGAEVEPLDWFLPNAVTREHVEGSTEDLRTLEPAFRTFLLAAWHAPADMAECDEVVRSQDYWNVGLTRDGFVFSPELPHVVQACGQDFTVDFDRVRPWLTPEGAAAVTALRTERR